MPWRVFLLSAVGQVREGCVLPRRCGVVHRVWECIGEKRSGIQVPVPYVFRNCGINQVSAAKHVQKSSGWERDLEVRATRFTDVLPPTLETSYRSPVKLDHLLVCSSCWGLKCFPEGWGTFCWGFWSLSKQHNVWEAEFFRLLPSQCCV